MGHFSSAKYIQAIAETRNISAAAEHLRISQPALSAQLKRLEESLGVLVFDRTKQPLEITEAGRLYLEYAARYQTIHREFVQHIADLSELKRGQLTVGGAASFNVSYLPKTVAQFCEKYPGIELEIVEGSIPEISAKALAGQVDMFIAPTVGGDDKLVYEDLLEEKIFLCVPPQWEINERLKKWQIPLEKVLSGEYGNKEAIPVVDFEKFKDCPFILLKKDQQIGQTMDELLKKYGFEPKKTVMTEQTMTSYNLTLAGVGVSLMTESTIRHSNFKEHPILYMADKDICMRKIYAVYSGHKYLSTAARKFMNMLEEKLRS